MFRPRPVATLLAAVTVALAGTAALAFSAPGGASGILSNGGPGAAAQPGRIVAIGAENQYADVIAQVGGEYTSVSALLSNPNTDPHTFEASIAVARQIGAARLIVQNGLGYDSFMNTIEDAVPSAGRTVIDVQKLLRLPGSTPNPHLWYDPATMPPVAVAIAAALARIEPRHAGYFRANAAAFIQKLAPWQRALSEFRKSFPHAAVAVTEPVADYLLSAAGADNLTPWTFQADVMNGVDPSPQDAAAERALLTGRKVRALVYNQQVTDPLTQALIALARASGVPVVGVYETMPEPGYDYQSWMLAETNALKNAIQHKTSTEHL